MFQVFHLILVAIGGAIGSSARYLLSLYITKTYPAAVFPYGTFAVNIIGCLFIGIIYGFTVRLHATTPEWRLFFATGICGGFTTFSAFAYENFQLLQTQNYTAFTLNTLGSCILGFAAVFLGVLLTKPFA